MASSKKGAKSAVRSVALVPTGGNLPALDDPSLREAAKAARKRSRPVAGAKISIRGKAFKVGGQNIGTGSTVRVSVVDWGYAKAYFDGPYSEQNPVPPACFALSMEPEGMVPHPKAADHQHTACAGCPQNVFGTATTGTGKAKACKDITRLIVLVETDLEDVEGVKGGKLLTLDLPPKSIQGWTKYSNDILDKFEREPLTILTELAFTEGDAFPVVEFRPVAALGDIAVIRAIKDRQAEAKDMILAPWEPVSAENKPKATGRAAPSRLPAKGGKRSNFG